MNRQHWMRWIEMSKHSFLLSTLPSVYWFLQNHNNRWPSLWIACNHYGSPKSDVFSSWRHQWNRLCYWLYNMTYKEKSNFKTRNCFICHVKCSRSVLTLTGHLDQWWVSIFIPWYWIGLKDLPVNYMKRTICYLHLTNVLFPWRITKFPSATTNLTEYSWPGLSHLPTPTRKISVCSKYFTARFWRSFFVCFQL